MIFWKGPQPRGVSSDSLVLLGSGSETSFLAIFGLCLTTFRLTPVLVLVSRPHVLPIPIYQTPMWGPFVVAPWSPKSCRQKKTTVWHFIDEVMTVVPDTARAMVRHDRHNVKRWFWLGSEASVAKRLARMYPNSGWCQGKGDKLGPQV